MFVPENILVKKMLINKHFGGEIDKKIWVKKYVCHRKFWAKKLCAKKILGSDKL